MTAQRYKHEREKRGTQASVSALLGVDRVTVARRETGALPVTHEAWLALLSLPELPPKKTDNENNKTKRGL